MKKSQNQNDTVPIPFYIVGQGDCQKHDPTHHNVKHWPIRMTSNRINTKSGTRVAQLEWIGSKLYPSLRIPWSHKVRAWPFFRRTEIKYFWSWPFWAFKITLIPISPATSDSSNILGVFLSPVLDWHIQDYSVSPHTRHSGICWQENSHIAVDYRQWTALPLDIRIPMVVS